jgi:cell division transport system ATP-binding protein
MIRLEGISVQYGPNAAGAPALDGLDLVLPQGGAAFVTGPAGAGKTALLDLLHLAVAPSGGRALVLEADLAQLDRAGRAALRRRIGRVFAPSRLLEDNSVFDNVVLPLLLSADGQARPDTRMRADVGELLGWLGLAGKSSWPARALSLGERRLVEVARAVIAQPALLLADGPTDGLDGERADQVMRLRWEMHLLGATTVIATTDARWLGWKPAPVIRLAQGRRVDDG